MWKYGELDRYRDVIECDKQIAKAAIKIFFWIL